jgi:hypothetical protein
MIIYEEATILDRSGLFCAEKYEANEPTEKKFRGLFYGRKKRKKKQKIII